MLSEMKNYNGTKKKNKIIKIVLKFKILIANGKSQFGVIGAELNIKLFDDFYFCSSMFQKHPKKSKT